MQQRDGADQQERLTAKEMQEREKQRAIIRQQYLGQQKQKRRIAKASDKFRYAPAPPSCCASCQDHLASGMAVVCLLEDLC